MVDQSKNSLCKHQGHLRYCFLLPTPAILLSTAATRIIRYEQALSHHPQRKKKKTEKKKRGSLCSPAYWAKHPMRVKRSGLDTSHVTKKKVELKK